MPGVTMSWGWHLGTVPLWGHPLLLADFSTVPAPVRHCERAAYCRAKQSAQRFALRLWKGRLVWIASPTATVLPRVRNDGGPLAKQYPPPVRHCERREAIQWKSRFVWIASPCGFAMTWGRSLNGIRSKEACSVVSLSPPTITRSTVPVPRGVLCGVVFPADCRSLNNTRQEACCLVLLPRSATDF
jgi:hypothetical protein